MLSTFLLTAIAGLSVASPTIVHRQSGAVYPDVADTRYATTEAVNTVQEYFTAKSLHDVQRWIGYFDTTEGVYVDATLGTFFSQPDLLATFEPVVAGWTADAKSYPLRIVGDANSAVVTFVDTPAVFGAEMRLIAAFDFRDGKVLRQVDYWDSRLNPVSAYRVPDDQFPTDFAESRVASQPNESIQRAADELHAALTGGNVTAVADLLTFDAVLQDFTTRTRIEGKAAIERYLNRALPTLPYGSGAAVRHVVGSAVGGAYEWRGRSGSGADNGITALLLNPEGFITELTTIWDASQFDNSTLQALAKCSIE
ncbi:hypothetical protein CGCF415_v014639 [Colletotrichum fructicola]|uniref:SnoaL-like domain-containing protein n=1 Tax=Colletotrichum fructicola (strain Nara gc5) TaxID=1213859 RepID=L2FBT5_COLFN|nr:uncharacterized protein CGMCC3_g13550 [Colletotrichum fructicola]KAF4491172.1 hypothetical protein CGGC5_v000127 [Colletotrichum fructicola Nara gc5]KAI8286284.1 hypothetical protein K4K60_000597 [Colletotrichum sp. SAR11_57]KAE9570447.1 hypothetical protein CGMCC3_g13550 [Colletotrichum fructicola]KAF4413862.1 hypothetical protein CFRS1_v012713 [Colletotrichum fructicola]KAF4888044.1 hypothetical protein CGCF415_v014639 [Colletotrichum fructicola]